MTAGGVGKFLFWSLTTGFNVVIILKLLMEIRNMVFGVLLVPSIDPIVTYYFIIVTTALKLITTILAFVGSMQNYHHLMIPFFVIQTLCDMHGFGVAIDKAIHYTEMSCFIKLMSIVDTLIREISHYIGWMFIAFSRYKEIEVTRRHRFFDV